MFLLKKKNFVDDFLYISESDLEITSDSDQEILSESGQEITSESDQNSAYYHETNTEPDFLNNQSYFYDMNIPSINIIYFDPKYILLGSGVILSSIFLFKTLKKW